MTTPSPPGHARSSQLPALIVSLVAVLAVSAIGGLAAASAPADYQALTQPSWAPPSWLFSPVWTVLYVSMAIAAWLVWQRTPSWRAPAIIAYIVQLLLNAAWTPLFFGLELRGAALFTIVVLDAALMVTIVLFTRIRRIAGFILLPYLMWTLFATALNYAVWSLNS